MTMRCGGKHVHQAEHEAEEAANRKALGDNESERELLELQGKLKKCKKDKAKYKEERAIAEARIKTLEAQLKALQDERKAFSQVSLWGGKPCNAREALCTLVCTSTHSR